MKLAFISDIHGNAVALDAVLEDIKKREVDKVFVLGDICYRGPEPQRSLDLVKSLNAQVIKGNADEWVVRGVREGEVPEQALGIMNQERDWVVEHLDSAALDYLESLPTDLKLEFEGLKIHAFHATPDSLFTVVLPFASDEGIEYELMQEDDADLYLYAHIHKPFIRYIKGKCVVNLGSVGLPFDGQSKPSYCLVDISEGSCQTSIIRVDYDVEKVVEQMEASDYPNKDLVVNTLRRGALG